MTTEHELKDAYPAGQGIAQAAGIIALGNVASRILGLVRETVIADLFGATGLVSAFNIASIVPKMIYELLIGGMVTAAMVPVFSDYASPERRRELWRLASAMFSLAVIAFSLLVLLLEFVAPQIAWILGGGFDAALQAQATALIRIILPSLVFFGLSGIATGLLYSLKDFTYPAFGAAIFNVGIIISSLLFARSLGIASLSFGVLLGSILQMAIQLPGLRRVRLTFSLNLSHPGLYRIIQLYIPVILSLVISQVGIAIDRNLASRTGEQTIAWMAAATTLIQFPLGLVSMAISMAVLPSLSQFDVSAELEGFKQTLALGLRLVLVLIIPAAVGLFVLGKPIIALIFEHGEFTAYDTAQTALALRFYLLGLPFAAIDLPLIFAFYARKDTRTPVMVGILGVIIYLIVALATIHPLGMVGLVLANSAQLTGHALIMLVLLYRRLEGVSGYHLLGTTLKALLASAAMGFAAYPVLVWLGGMVDASTLLGEVAMVGGTGVAGLVTYAAMISLLGVEEAKLIWEVIWTRLRGAAA